LTPAALLLFWYAPDLDPLLNAAQQYVLQHVGRLGYSHLLLLMWLLLLLSRYARDVHPPLSAAQQYVVDAMGPLGYCHLLAVGSVDGLVEASRQSRVCAGAANEVACAIFR
jgi:hypothetical protein